MNSAVIRAICTAGLVLSASTYCATAVAAAGTTKAHTPTSSAPVICSYAPSQSSVVRDLAAVTGGVAFAAQSVAQALGLSAVLHSSGAYIFTGTGGYVAGTFGTAGALPVIVTVAVVTGTSVVTLELVCIGKNHPELVTKITATAAEFMNRSRAIAVDASQRASASVEPFIAESRGVIARARADAFEYANRASVRFTEVVKTK